MFWKAKEIRQPVREMIERIKSGKNVKISEILDSGWAYHVDFYDDYGIECKRVPIAYVEEQAYTTLEWMSPYEVEGLWNIVYLYLVKPLKEQERSQTLPAIEEEKNSWCDWFGVKDE